MAAATPPFATSILYSVSRTELSRNVKKETDILFWWTQVEGHCLTVNIRTGRWDTTHAERVSLSRRAQVDAD